MTGSTYNAIRVHKFGDSSELKLEVCPALTLSPTDENKVLVNIKAAGVNPVETYIRSGTHVRKPILPYTPGNDGAGIISAVTPDVTNVKVGDRVFIASSLTGTYAEQCIAYAHKVHQLPEALSFSQGAGIYTPYYTAYRALIQKAQAKKGESVLIHGATGGVGMATMQWARMQELTVFGTAGSKERCELLLKCGAHYAFCHNEENYMEEIRNKALEISDQKSNGVDIIIEMLANKNLGNDLKVLNYGGRVVVIGNRGTVEINPRDTMGREACIMGVALAKSSTEDLDKTTEALNKGISQCFIMPVLGQMFKLKNANLAHEEVISHSAGTQGKIVLITDLSDDN